MRRDGAGALLVGGERLELGVLLGLVGLGIALEHEHVTALDLRWCDAGADGQQRARVARQPASARTPGRALDEAGTVDACIGGAAPHVWHSNEGLGRLDEAVDVHPVAICELGARRVGDREPTTVLRHPALRTVGQAQQGPCVLDDDDDLHGRVAGFELGDELAVGTFATVLAPEAKAGLRHREPGQRGVVELDDARGRRIAMGVGDGGACQLERLAAEHGDPVAVVERDDDRKRVGAAQRRSHRRLEGVGVEPVGDGSGGGVRGSGIHPGKSSEAWIQPRHGELQAFSEARRRRASYPVDVQERQLTPQGIATRERIVQAATNAIAEHGVGSMSLDHVMTSAGASKGQLYHYFADRDDLVRAAVAATGTSVLEVQAEMMADLDDFGAIERWFDCLVDLQVTLDSRGGCPLASLTGALADRDEESRRLLIDSFDAWEARLASGLASMRSTGVLRTDCDTECLATSTMASVQGGLVLTQVRRDPTQLRIALDAALAHMRTYATA